MLLCPRERGVGRCLLEPVNGYWPVFHRIFSEFVSALPLTWWPVILPISGAALTALLPVVLAHVTTHIRTTALRGVIVFSPVLLPALGLEFINVVGNAHWTVLLFAIFSVLDAELEGHAQPGRLAVLFFGGISGPVGFATIVAVLGVSIARRAEIRKAMSRLLAAGAGFGIQAAMILWHRGDDRVGSSLDVRARFEAVTNDVLGVIPGLHVTREVPISFLSYSSALSPIVLFGTFVGVGLLVLLRARQETTRLGAAMLCAALSMSIFLALTLDPNPRYEYAIGLIVTVGMLLVLVGVVAATSARNAIAGLMLLVWLPAFAAGPFRTTPSEVSWSTQLSEGRSACAGGSATVLLHFAPERFLETSVSCEVVLNLD